MYNNLQSNTTGKNRKLVNILKYASLTSEMMNVLISSSFKAQIIIVYSDLNIVTKANNCTYFKKTPEHHLCRM